MFFECGFRRTPFTHYSHEIAPAYANSKTTDSHTYHENSVFEDNDMYDTSDGTAATTHYDIPQNGGSVIVNELEPSYSEIGGRNSELSSNAQQTSNGLLNPLYVQDRTSIYSQPSKTNKERPRQPDVNADAADNQSVDYAELPDLPPRAYSEHQTQTSTYYNY